MSLSALSRGARIREVLSAAVVAGVIGMLVARPGGLRLAVAATLVVPACVIAGRAPRSALYGLVVWLSVLGLVRRLVSGVSAKSALGDPLLLVGAGTWAVLAIVAVQRGALTRRSPLTNAVLGLGGLLAVSVLNPLQGGLTVGLSGAVLVVVPMSAFLIGRTLVDDFVFARLLWLVAVLGVAAALYGMLQTFVGLPSWDATWVANEGYGALNVFGVIRPFSSFSAASEYVGFLGLALVAWLALRREALKWPLVGGAAALLAVALWYGSSRSIIVLVVVAVGLMMAARAGLPLGQAALVGLVVLAALPVTIGWLSPARFSDGDGGTLAAHQVQGLTDPFGADSTLPGHIKLVQDGIESAWRNPLGTGVGSITASATKFGGVAGTAEGDPGRAPFAVGVPGLLAYAAVVVIGLSRAYRLAASRRDAVSLGALGMVAVTFFQWLNGGQYAVVFWAWLALGWIDTAVRRRLPTNAHQTAMNATTWWRSRRWAPAPLAGMLSKTCAPGMVPNQSRRAP